jgi:hypothetical protein
MSELISSRRLLLVEGKDDKNFLVLIRFQLLELIIL